MASVDNKVAALVDKALPDESHSGDENDLFDELEEDDSALDAFREQRMQQLHEELARARYMRSQDYGKYAEVTDEKQLMDITTSTKYCVVHFFHTDFRRCQIMSSHLETLAPKHFDTRFIRIDAEKAPFLVTKLKIKILPCVIAFVEGIAVDRVIGFDGLGHSEDTFTTSDLEQRLLKAGVLQRAKTTDVEPRSVQHVKQGGPRQQVGDDSDEDWD
ncbi:hypothetical protein GP486_002440 [Trichoglossum hirsutum]|uniref:Phosducin domain-containing protein n=1 Tax=Trichoglossum hirsutum TaxID=265104 RepID=A0A9P8LES9_9PEZI|nr:hypothetical protein GP486_002440 [Trichoglossum hirsutum]